jgi:hypothetical protein
MSGREQFKHELALALQMTVSQLSRSMTEREFTRWAVYRARHMLPQRRLEYGLAMVARSMTGGTLADYLLDTGDDKPRTTPKQRAIEKTLLGGSVFRLGQRKKKG